MDKEFEYLIKNKELIEEITKCTLLRNGFSAEDLADMPEHVQIWFDEALEGTQQVLKSIRELGYDVVQEKDVHTTRGNGITRELLHLRNQLSTLQQRSKILRNQGVMWAFMVLALMVVLVIQSS